MSEAVSEKKKVAEAKPEDESKIGTVKISAEVVATVAGIATSEIKGVAGMSSATTLSGIADMLGGKKNKGRGVKVELGEDSCVIDIYIVVDYGTRIPDVAWEVQENVKNSVESMTGMKAEKINIHIVGISFEKEKKLLAEEDGEED